ncbi:hypothetical protein RWE15_05130 [Virgibacillus halophilus]|uniref:Major Facilitator Superfamily protein n=1 Tax=Tigheibacillus halophilus TaxID=361280 RepID=A0ABU5C3S8_9BACI|nr:hypothetical protein [Virgibacillus halophilus]
MFIIGSPYLAIELNALALCVSAVIIFLLPNLELRGETVIAEKVSIKVIRKDWREILSFSKSNMHITFVYVLFSGITVFMTALDSLEAAFATKVLSLSESAYGFLVSIAGIGIITGSLINALFASRWRTNILLGFGAIFTPIGYLIFAYSQEFIWASIGFFYINICLIVWKYWLFNFFSK